MVEIVPHITFIGDVMTTVDKVVKQFSSPFYQVYKNARQSADVAEKAFFAKHGEPIYPCGFAWVVITDGRSPFVRWLKSCNIGNKNYGKGWQIWNPNESMTQSVDIKEAGARAFAEALQAQGIECYYSSRLD